MVGGGEEGIRFDRASALCTADSHALPPALPACTLLPLQVLASFANGRIEEFLTMRSLEVRLSRRGGGEAALPAVVRAVCCVLSALELPPLVVPLWPRQHASPSAPHKPLAIALTSQPPALRAPSLLAQPDEMAAPALVPAIAATLRRFHDIPAPVRSCGVAWQAHRNLAML